MVTSMRMKTMMMTKMINLSDLHVEVDGDEVVRVFCE